MGLKKSVSPPRTPGHTSGRKNARRAGKLYMARSRLYRSRFLQVNTSTRLKTLAEIYVKHSFAQLESKLKTMKSAQLSNLN